MTEEAAARWCRAKVTLDVFQTAAHGVLGEPFEQGKDGARRDFVRDSDG